MLRTIYFTANAPSAEAACFPNARTTEAVTVRDVSIRAAAPVTFQHMRHARSAVPALFPPVRSTRAAQPRIATTDPIPMLAHTNGK